MGFWRVPLTHQSYLCDSHIPAFNWSKQLVLMSKSDSAYFIYIQTDDTQAIHYFVCNRKMFAVISRLVAAAAGNACISRGASKAVLQEIKRDDVALMHINGNKNIQSTHIVYFSSKRPKQRSLVCASTLAWCICTCVCAFCNIMNGVCVFPRRRRFSKVALKGDQFGVWSSILLRGKLATIQ